jgi:hypothetical protein
MTSEEIKAKTPIDLSERAWMREIAMQLALLNEKKPEPKPNFPPKQHR